MTAGYSGTPLAKKLGIKTDMAVAAVNEPDDFRTLLGDLPDGVTFDDDGSPDVLVAFYVESAALTKDLPKLAERIFPDRVLWLAWPKKTSGVDTDLTGDVVRATVLDANVVDGIVDVKVCAISEIWSGLKIMWCKERRSR